MNESYEPEYVIACINSLTEETSCVSMTELPTGVFADRTYRLSDDE
jgi:hypothetical protein